jgi:Uma2 family endonuclease
MTVQEMRERKKQLGYTNEMISDRSGVPLGTVQKIFSGETASPRYDTLLALESVFEPKQEMKETISSYYVPEKEYTIDDYYEMPDEMRVELIDGKFYDLGAPSVKHQLATGELFFQLTLFIKNNKGSCEVFIAPLDVRLDLDNKTMLQPDVMVICDPKKTEEGKRVEGAPDFIAEVFSPNSIKIDFQLKYKKYKKAGVREYWMIDTENRTVYCSDFTQDKIVMEIHSFDDKIPVKIFSDNCEIDLSSI